MTPNQIVQITGHKNLLSINNYSSLRERQIKNISKILSSSSLTTNAVLPAVQQSLEIHFTEAHSSTSGLQLLKAHSKQCFKEIISLEVFSISIWQRLKIQSQVQNWGRKRKKKEIYN